MYDEPVDLCTETIVLEGTGDGSDQAAVPRLALKQ